MFILYTQLDETKEVEILKIGTKEECVKAAYDYYKENTHSWYETSLEEVEYDLDHNRMTDFRYDQIEHYKLREV